MKTGFRVYSDFRRADEKLIKELSDIPSANISDSMNRMYAMYGGIRPFNGKKNCRQYSDRKTACR